LLPGCSCINIKLKTACVDCIQTVLELLWLAGNNTHQRYS
jgi:hypothetical protein